MVLECLQLHPNLEMLEVSCYPGSKISSWLSSMINLIELSLECCVNCKHLPPLHQLSSLKVLRLSGLEALESVSEIEMQKELRSAKSTAFFPTLEVLDIFGCPNLMGWWRSDVGEALNAQLPCFPFLSTPRIKNCPNLTSMLLFPSIKELALSKIRWKPLIQQMMKMKRTTSEAPSSSSPSSSSSSIFPPFSKLKTMFLHFIEDLDSLPEEFLQNLTSLQRLTIKRCFNLTLMPEGMHHLTSSKILRTIGCPQ